MNKIYNPFYKLLFFVGIFAYSSLSVAQVSSGDSLALVAFYNGTSGAAWVNHSNWLTGNVPTWYGITASGGRVTQINLPSNNISGAVPASLSGLTDLVRVDLSNNALTSFPSLAGLSLDSLKLANNMLTFSSLVPNAAAASGFIYAPQDSVDADMDTILVQQGILAISSSVDQGLSPADHFQWFLNNDSITGNNSHQISITCMDSAQAGVYTCAIVNSGLSGLTLYRRVTVLGISSLSNPGTNFSVCGSNSSLQGVAAPAGGTVLWSNVSGSAVIANVDSPVTAVSGLAIGPNVFNYQVSAGNLSCPANTYSNAQVTITRDTNPSPAYAGANFSVCGPQAFLSADTPSVGIGTWTVISLGSVSVSQPNDPVTAVNGLSQGVNIFRWQIVNGACAPAYFSEVKVFRDDTLTSVYAGKDTSICPTSYTLNAQLPADAEWSWSVVTGSGSFAADSSTQTFENDTNIITPVTGLSEFQNTYLWTVWNTCNTVSSTVTVNVYDFTIANAGPDENIFYSPINAYPLADSVAVGTGGTGQYTYVWAPTTNIDSPDAAHPNFLTPSAGTYTYSVTVTDGHGCTASASATYVVTQKEYLTVPTLFTPNGDGINDVLYIPGIESYPNNVLTVVDRNDQVVYKKNGYTNDWGGTNELGFSGEGSKLPADTYYYTLNLGGGQLVQTGFFLIKY